MVGIRPTATGYVDSNAVVAARKPSNLHPWAWPSRRATPLEQGPSVRLPQVSPGSGADDAVSHGDQVVSARFLKASSILGRLPSTRVLTIVLGTRAPSAISTV